MPMKDASIPLPRRSFLGVGLVTGLGLHPNADALTRTQLKFPRDAGAHPDFTTEWWYVTGYVNSDGGDPTFGFQVTFFRSRVAKTQNMQSRLAARQLIFAHAAVTDVKGKKLWHDQRMARASGAEPGENPLDAASASTRRHTSHSPHPPFGQSRAAVKALATLLFPPPGGPTSR